MNDGAPRRQEETPRRRDKAIQQAMAAKARHEAHLLQKANVIGVGVGFRERGGVLADDEVVLVVNVTRKLPNDQLAPEDVIPCEIEGVPVDVRETGEIWAL